ncbi:hypothetical protein Tco_0626050 [Tanacetum coccineum]|uniref:Maturase K n=1 Tax=Tanacetum coccineum TaxID=301880 RepID=A0ABQ4WIP5_9ASTR
MRNVTATMANADNTNSNTEEREDPIARKFCYKEFIWLERIFTFRLCNSAALEFSDLKTVVSGSLQSFDLRSMISKGLIRGKVVVNSAQLLRKFSSLQYFVDPGVVPTCILLLDQDDHFPSFLGFNSGKSAGGRTASPGNILENLRKLVVLYLFPYAFPLLLGGISVLKRCLASLAMYLELFEQEINCQRESLSYVLSFEKVKVSFRKEMNKFLIEYDQGVSSNQSWINDVETTQFSALGLC